MSFSTGLVHLDEVLRGILPGDNIVWQVESIEDYPPFVQPFIAAAEKEKIKLIYFRFAQHQELIPKSNKKIKRYNLHPEDGFETFISEIFNVIEKQGPNVCYVFDCLSELVVDWYSDRMLGNFFRLTCPYLYDFSTVTYFALLKNYHSSYATDMIHNTAQVVIDVYRNKEKIYLHPQKVWQRYSPTLYMLHLWEGKAFLPVTRSATITEILSKTPQPWLDFTNRRLDVWSRTIIQAQDTLTAVRTGKMPEQEPDYYKHRLLRMFFTRDPRLLQLAERYLNLEDLLEIRKRMIGTGLIGGKAAGMLLARAILSKTDGKWIEKLETHDSFYVGSDVFYTYLVQNDCWWVRRKQRDPNTLLEGAEEAQQKLLSGKFPEDIQHQFKEMLDYFGQSPIIVRSSSLLEDAYGNSFSGKYESVFCANQGTPQERLENFINAVRRVYASTMSKEALTYRKYRGLLDRDEQMALLIQRVSGAKNGDLYFPQIAGVGFSFNPYVWNSDIDPKAGMLRIVFGLGTRAVGRSDDDYTRVVALNVPQKRPEATFDAVKKYAQRRIDILDLQQNELVTRYFEDIAKSVEELPISLFATRDEELEKRAEERGLRNVFSWVLTFDTLFSGTEFVQDMRALLQILHQAYAYAVDVEFTLNFLEDGTYRINLLQCRPFQVKDVTKLIELAAPTAPEQVILETQGPIIGNSVAAVIDRLIYVVPSIYGKMKMSDRYAIARLIGELTHLEDKFEIPNSKIQNLTSEIKKIMLIGPGRWGTSTPALGIPVTFAEINTVSVLCEIAIMHVGLVPDISLGTHFFNDLVEQDMLYVALYPEKEGYVLNENRLKNLPNQLPKLLPNAAKWADAVWVIDTVDAKDAEKQTICLNMNAIKQTGICYIKTK
jgi:hypothetical protein